ncbi:MAG: S1 RNA-binding domain-containing protein [Bacilli bacterium]|nr:S1 RNA-binding domain-containing protein [Bacilli bacterium]
MKNYKTGDIVKGKVTGIEDYGIFVLVDQNTTGLIHISEISDGFVRNVEDYATIGDIISAEVIAYDEINDKLKLSIKKNECKDNVNKLNPIKETKSGFNTLSKSLDIWISQKQAEMFKK